MLWQRRTTMPCGKRRRFMYRYFHVETLVVFRVEHLHVAKGSLVFF